MQNNRHGHIWNPFMRNDHPDGSMNPFIYSQNNIWDDIEQARYETKRSQENHKANQPVHKHLGNPRSASNNNSRKSYEKEKREK